MTTRPSAAQLRLLRLIREKGPQFGTPVAFDRRTTNACCEAGWLETRWNDQGRPHVLVWVLTDAGRSALAAAEEAGT